MGDVVQQSTHRNPISKQLHHNAPVSTNGTEVPCTARHSTPMYRFTLTDAPHCLPTTRSCTQCTEFVDLEASGHLTPLSSLPSFTAVAPPPGVRHAAAIFANYNPLETLKHEQQQQQVATPTPCHTSSALQQLPSCPLVAVPPAFAPAASSGLWAEGFAGLAHACAPAAPPLGWWPLGASADCFWSNLLLGVVPLACATTTAASPAAALSSRRIPIAGGAGAGAVGPHLLLAATAVAQAAVPPAGVSPTPGAGGSGGSCCGVAAPSHCHVSQPAAHVHADAHRHVAAASSHSHVARQPEQEEASFAVLRTPLRTPFGLRSRLPPMRFVCTPAGVRGRGCGGGGGK